MSYDPFDPDAWSGAPGCEAFEIALDMRAQGALAPAAVPVLEAHLGSCASCRAHAASQARVAAALSAAVPAAPDWQAVHARVQASVTRARLATWIAAGAVLSGLGAALGMRLLGGASRLPLAPVAALAAVALGLLAGGYWLSRRRLRALLESRDIVAAYRGELETSIKRLERTLRTGSIAIVILGGRLVFGIAHGPGARASLVMMGLMLAASLSTLALYPMRARTLRRRLAELR